MKSESVDQFLGNIDYVNVQVYTKWLVQAETADACIYMIIVILLQKYLLGGLKRDFGPGVQFFEHSFLVCFIMTS